MIYWKIISKMLFDFGMLILIGAIFFGIMFAPLFLFFYYLDGAYQLLGFIPMFLFIMIVVYFLKVEEMKKKEKEI